MIRHARQLALLSVVSVPLFGFAFGGWAVVTLDDVPSYLVAGKSTPISFLVRQHGITLLSNLSPSIELSSGSIKTTVAAAPSGEAGHYQATIIPPSPGMWTVVVNSGFGNSRTTLLPLRATAPNAPAPRVLADAERGKHLFYGKGCTTCHVRGSDGDANMQVGPNLTGRRYVADYVAKFLDDPEASPLSKASPDKTAKMPKLGLKLAEISALVAFLNTTEVAVRP